MKFLLVTKEDAIVEAARKAYGTHYELRHCQSWEEALEKAEGVDLMFVDLIATLREEGRIQGYEDFAHAKMAHEVAAAIPLVVIAAPPEYELDAMVGWPNFVFAMVKRPITDRFFRMASGWV